MTQVNNCTFSFISVKAFGLPVDLAQKDFTTVPQTTRMDQTELVFISSITGQKLPTVDCLGR